MCTLLLGGRVLGDKRGNISGDVTAAWKVSAAAVRPHNVRAEKRKKEPCEDRPESGEKSDINATQGCRQDFTPVPFAAPMYTFEY